MYMELLALPGSIVTILILGTSPIGSNDSSDCYSSAGCPTDYYCIDDGYDTPISCPLGAACPTDGGTSYTDCPDGTFSDVLISSTASCQQCTQGYFCVAGSDEMVECPGTSYSEDDADVSGCPTDYYCIDDGYDTPISCPLGAACPTDGGTSYTDCPDGTFSDVLISSTASCQQCTQGYFCVAGSDEMVECPGTSYSEDDADVCMTLPERKKKSGTYITDCSSGKYCPGDHRIEMDCATDHFCPETIYQWPCPADFYTVSGDFLECLLDDVPEDPVVCETPGQYYDTGSEACTVCCSSYPCSYECPDGVNRRSCPYGTVNAGDNVCLPPQSKQYYNGSTSFQDCPAGTYAPVDGLDACWPCPTGFYQNLAGRDYCEICPGGYSCTASAQGAICGDGYYSPEGVWECIPCPSGHYCVSGDAKPTPCSAGTYPDQTDRASCSTCTTGHYCPYATEYPIACPAGTYNDITGQDDLADCSPCDAGYYCNQGSSSSTENDCPAEHYCPIGSAYPIPCGFGETNGMTTGTLTNQSVCTDCTAGYYCPEGAGERICPAGYYCPLGTKDYSINECTMGYYSHTEGFTSDADCVNDGVTATLCPSGFYCPPACLEPIACAPGYFNDTAGMNNRADCRFCPEGYSCPQPGMTTPDDCKIGHYCPTGTIRATDNPCPPGKYTSDINAATCTDCTEGFACVGYGSTADDRQSCDYGYVCPTGSWSIRQEKCPAGTYNPNLAQYDDAIHCLDCPEGYFCPTGTGIIDDATLGEIRDDLRCPAGYYCPTGTKVSTFRKDIDTYDPATYNAPVPCPAGKYRDTRGGIDENDCIECPEGYMCPLDSTTNTPSTFPRVCPVGYYQDSTGQDTCVSCPEGAVCEHEGTYSPVYCEAGTLSQFNKCVDCPIGSYCPKNASDTNTEELPCPAGLFCSGGTAAIDTSTTPNSCPNDEMNCSSCSEGYYCPDGTLYEVPCPKGRFRATVGAQYDEATGVQSTDYECASCTAGYYCLGGGNPDPDGECSAGFYCPEGSSGPFVNACPSGSYRDETGAGQLSDCIQCPAGFYCPIGSTSYISCPEGQYCPIGRDTSGITEADIDEDNDEYDTPKDCPEGTYNPSTELESEDDCTPCDAGNFCSGVSLTTTSGTCSSGFFCITNAITATPDLDVYYETYAAGCPSDYSCLCTDGLTTDCDTCTDDSYKTCRANFGVCPVGHFCEGGTAVPSACPPGTYNPSTGMKLLSDCLPCPESYYCPDSGMEDPTADGDTYKCAAGYYCDGGAIREDQTVVPVGYYSTLGSSEPIMCEAGYYSNEEGLSACKECPSGFYCPLRTDAATGESDMIDPIDCPAGYYCPAGYSSPVSCPVGTWSSQLNLREEGDCDDCPAGHYCNSEALSNISTRLCDAGYICRHNAATSQGDPYGGGDDPLIGGACPAGFYCPAATTKEIPCPVGTFSSKTMLSLSTQCESCTAGMYCSQTGLTA
ncbi:uncharacterized protein LOC105348209 isoform X2, partial [Aduncisulcus paluster]